MIDFYDISLFFRQGLLEVIQYAVYLGVIYVLKVISEKRNRNQIVTVALFFAFVWNICMAERKMEMVETVLFAIMLVSILKAVDLLEMDVQNLILVFCALLIPRRLFNSSSGIWGDGLFYFIIWAVLILFHNKMAKKVLGRYIMLTYLALCSFLYFRIQDVSIRLDGIKYLIFDVVTVLCMLVLTYHLARKWKNQLLQLDVLENKYSGMAGWGVVFEIISVLTFILMPIPFVMTGSITESQKNIVSLFNIGVLLIEIVYILCLYHMAEYKTTSYEMERLIEEDNEYRRFMDDNLEQMANIRHDMKNIFLTMEYFVERSNDEEMKAFYKEKISPFAEKEMKQNYFLAQLQQIPSEMLRAFLYTKLSEIVSQETEVRLTILIDKTRFGYGMEFVDLVRICGILIDNAKEECAGRVDAKIVLSVKTNENEVVYSIQNTVRDGHDFGKMLEGKSDKEGHTGRGLKIVKKILGIYPNVVLSTYHDSKIFWQTLRIQIH